MLGKKPYGEPAPTLSMSYMDLLTTGHKYVTTSRWRIGRYYTADMRSLVDSAFTARCQIQH